MSSFQSKLSERASHVATLSKDAVTSRTYLYPPLGVVYLLRHPLLWAPIATRLLSCALLSIGVLTLMFLLTYLPQAAVLTMINGPLGPTNAAFLVLSESTFLTTVLAKAFVLQNALLDIFDATLVCEGQEFLVAKGREVKPGGRHAGLKKLGGMVSKPVQRVSPAAIAEYLIMLPLNLIPFVGTAAFLILQGRKTAPSYHARYFQLKGFSDDQRNAFIAERKGSYIAFGTASMVMNLVPLASIIFTFTTTVGAALWATELETGTKDPGASVDISGEQAKQSEMNGKKEL